MEKYKKTILFIIFIFVIAILVFPMRTSVVFYVENTDRISAYLPLKEGKTFEIIFTHSIHLTDVVEKYKILENGEIEQFEIIFEEFGIGMPSTVKDDEEFVYEDGKYHIKNMNNIFPSLNIRNGKTVSKHRLVWYDGRDKQMIYFNDYFEPGAWFTVKINRLSLLQLWKEVKIRE